MMVRLLLLCWLLRSGLCLVGGPVVVALTREVGKNDGLRDRLASVEGLVTVEVPCVAQVAEAAGLAKLESLLREGTWRWVALTSPEAAAVFSDVISASNLASPPVATVGAASARKLKGDLASSFSPTKATAKTLAAELPGEEGDAVLFPCSTLAATTLEKNLSDRGFAVMRVETYRTEPATWDPRLENCAREADLVAFASPSAVDVWRQRIGPNPRAVCVGETTAQACDKAGFHDTTYPDNPGLDGWQHEIIQAAHHIRSTTPTTMKTPPA